MNPDMLLSVAGAFGGLELLKWLVSLKTSKKKAETEIADNLEDLVSKRLKGIEDSVIFLQQQLREKENQVADLTEKYQASLNQTIKLTKQFGEMKLRYQSSRCNLKTCTQRKPPFKWMQKVVTPVIMLLLILPLGGCSKKIYVPVEKVVVKTDSVERKKIFRDTVMIKDSVVLATKGDTILKEVWKWRTRTAVVADTVIIARTDSLKEPKIVEMPASQSRNPRLSWLKFTFIGFFILLIFVLARGAIRLK